MKKCYFKKEDSNKKKCADESKKRYVALIKDIEMLKSIKKSLLLVSLIPGIVTCDEKEFVEYKPHYLNPNSDQKYYGEAALDSAEFANTLHVLKFYGEEYQTENGNAILITRELSNDWDLLWNYTSKANDIEWLRAHPLD